MLKETLENDGMSELELAKRRIKDLTDVAIAMRDCLGLK